MTKIIITVQVNGAWDNWDLLIPRDTASHTSLAALRASLFQQYADEGFPRDLAALAATAITPANSGADALDVGREWSLSPQMPNMAALFNSGDMAIVSDIAATAGIITKAQAIAGVNLPPAEQSHNDHQSILMTLAIDGASPTGIAGKLSDLVAAKNALSAEHAKLNRIAFGSSPFLTGADSGPFKLKADGVASQLIELAEAGLCVISSIDTPTEYHALRNMLSAIPDGVNTTAPHYTPRTILEASTWQKRQQLTDVGTVYTNWVGEAIPAPNASFTPTPLSSADAGLFFSQAHPAIVNMIARSDSVTPGDGGLDHLFIHVTKGVPGVDSHSDQAQLAPVGQRYMDNFINRLWGDIVTLGKQNDVYIQIVTEFGRTITPNLTGTDHAWGGVQFHIGGPGVLGASGGKIIGGTPASPDFDPANPNDPANPYVYNTRGYVIPKSDNRQATANIGLFLGLTPDEMVNGIMTPQGLVPGAFPELATFIPDGGSTVADAILPIVQVA